MKTKNKFSRSDIVIIVTVIGLSALLVTLFAMLMNYAITSDFYEVDISPHTENFESTTTSRTNEQLSEAEKHFSTIYDINVDVEKVATCNRDFTLESENNIKYSFHFLDKVNIVDFDLEQDTYIILMDNGDTVHVPYSYLE